MKHIYLKKLISVKNQQSFLVLVAVFLLNLINSINAQNRDAAPFSKYAPSDELVSIRNRNTKQFRNPDGSISAFVGSSPIHYYSGAGWKDIENTISYREGQDYNYFNESNSFFNYFPNNPFTTPVKYSYNNINFEETVVSIDFIDVKGHVISKLPLNLNTVNSNVSGNKITYSNFNNELELVYTLENTRRKFDLVVKTANFLNQIPSHASKIHINEKVILNKSFETTTDENGINILVEGENILSFVKPIAYDNDLEHEFNAQSGYINSSVNQIEHSIQITSAFDVAWLKAGNRVFPVKLDPVAAFLPSFVTNWTGYQTSNATKTSGFLRITDATTASWAKYNISGIPAGSTINTITYWGNHYSTTGTAKYCKITQMTSDPVAAAALTIWNAATSGVTYNASFLWSTTTYGWRSALLNATATTYMQTNLALGWFAVGAKFVSGGTTFAYHYGVNGTAGTITYLNIDYITPGCTGTPLAGTAAISVASGCAGTPFTLSATGTNAALTGITYQWQSGPSATGPWTNIAGATATSTLISTGASATTFYRLLTTCANSGLSAASNAVSFTSALPPAGTAAISVSSGCANVPFTLSATGLATGGTSFQWQSAPTSTGPWTNVTGATATSTTIATGVTSTTFYQLLSFCTANSTSSVVTANVVSYSITLSGPCVCGYNAITYASTTFDEEITNVTIGTLNNTSACNVTAPGFGSIANRYGNFTGFVAAPTFIQGASYPFSLTQTSCGGVFTNFFQIYIDYNQNGSFADAGEQVYVQPTAVSGNQTATGNITIPVTALAGTTRMRVVNIEGTSTTALYGVNVAYSYGETEDYCVTISAGSGCTGTPNTGTAAITSSVGCPNAAFTLSGSGLTIGGGITYQWQSGPSATGPWTNINGATASSTLISTGAAATTYYRVVTTCTAGPSTATSNVISYSVSSNPCSCLAYGASAATSTLDDEIFNVTLGTLNNTSNCTQTGGAGSTLNMYSNYTGIVAAPSLTQAGAYSLSVTVGQCSGTAYSGIVRAFIDFNQNGLFTDAGEAVYTSATTVFAVAGTVLGANITVPATASLGITRMRVIAVEGGAATQAPTGTYTWGETEDYCVNIVAAPQCAGTPAGGTSSASSASVCTSNNFTVTNTSQSIGLGITYQWASGPSAAGPWTLLGTAATVYAPLVTTQTVATYYSLVSTCTAAATSATSTPVLVSMTSGACSCLTYGSSAATSAADDEIFNVTLGTLNNTSNCTQTGGAGSILNMYSNYAGLVAAPSLTQAGVYSFSATVGQCSGFQYSGNVTVYIDFNQNGLFTDAGENVYTSPNTPFSVTGTTLGGNITIPLTASVGVTRMRVIAVEGGAAAQPPTGTYTWGETEDYCVNIVAAPTCTGTPLSGTTSASSSSVCSSANFTVSNTGQTALANMTYQWQKGPSATGPWTNIGTALTTYSNLVTTQTVATYYQLVTTCNSVGGSSVASTPVLVGVTSGICQCGTYCAATNMGSACLTNVNINNINNTSLCSAAPNYYSYASATTTLAQNSVYTFSVTTDASAIVSVWFDWNQNQIFEATEWYQPYTAALSGSISVTIPSSALLGETRMRVRSRLSLNTNGSGDACLAMGSGETEDYCITIVCPLITATASPAAGVCLGSTATITAGGATSYTWIPGSLTGTSVTVSPSSTTIYTVSGTNPMGCLTNTTISLSVLPLPTLVTTASPSAICIGSSATLTGSGASTYTWLPGSLIGTPQTVNPSSSTLYTLTATGANGCVNTKTLNLVVNNLPTVAASVSPATVCAGSAATLSASGATTYTWLPGTSLVGASTTVSPASFTNYTVTGTDANGCANTSTVDLSVNALPVISASSNSTNICYGSAVSLSASGANTYTWTPGNLSGSPVNDSPLITTTYTVTGTDNNGCNGTSTISVAVSTTVTALASPSAICSGGSSTLTGSNATTYTWDPGSLPGNSITVSPTSLSTYTLTGTDVNGCVSTTTVSVSIDQTPTVTPVANPAIICSGGLVNLTATGAASYTWTPGSFIGASVNDSPSSSTVYSVTGASAAGCLAASAQTVLVTVGGTATTTVNFYEGFEGIVYNNQLPNCSWLTSSPGNACKTYTVSDPATNRVPSSGNNFACFQAPTAPGGDYFYTNAVQLTAGAVYSMAISYVTSPGSNWTKFGLMVNSSQSPRGGGGLGSQNSIMAANTITVITNGFNNALPHASIGATFSVTTTGFYYLIIFAEGTTGFLTFDDKNTTMYSNLPIELVSYSATKHSDVVKLDWRTQSELNSEKFIIEKSLDAVKWDFVAETNAAGNSTTIQDYTTYDNNPYYGISYYRLLQQDIDKTMHNYGIRTVNFSRDRVSEIMLMPNPTSGNVNFDYYSQYKGSLSFKVSDVAGKVVIPETNAGDIIDNKKSGTIYLNEFKPGVYFVEFNCNNLKTVKKIIKH